MLPYDAEALFAQFALYNTAFWPVLAAAAVLMLGTVLMTLGPVRHAGRVTAAVLAAAWLWTGIAYHFLTFAGLNFAAPAYGALFVLQGLLILWTGVVQDRLSFRFRYDAAGWAGLGLALAALVLLPAADWLLARNAAALRLPGMAPAPTALFTLAMLLLLDGRVLWRLALIPLAWTLVAGATGWILSVPQDLVLPLAGAVFAGLALARNRRPARGGFGQDPGRF